MRIYGQRRLLFMLLVAGFMAASAQATAPTVGSVVPNSALVGSGPTTVTLLGSGYNSSSVVVVAGERLQPTIIDQTSLTVVIPPSLLTTSVALGIYVTDSVTLESSELSYFYVYSATPPTVNSMIPAGGLRGTTTLVVLGGTDLTGATFAFSGTGVSAVPQGAAVQVSVAAEAPYGPQTVTVSTPSGSTTACGARSCTFTVVESGSWADVSGPSSLQGAAVVRLLDGRVLAAGGSLPAGGGASTAVASAQIFDPSVGQWIPTASMNTRRAGGAACLLPDGQVLVAGGYDFSSSALLSAEIYNPATGTWSAAGTMTAPGNNKALLLPNGKVLVQHASLDFAADLFDPITRRFQVATGITLQAPATRGVAMELLSDGRVLLIGGGMDNRIYDPATATLSPVPAMSPISSLFAQLLPDGRALVGGVEVFGRIVTPHVFLYNPQSNTVIRAAAATSGAGVLLATGSVLISGAVSRRVGFGFETVPVAVLYDPITDQTFPQATATSIIPPSILLNDGRALGFGSSYGSPVQAMFAQVYVPAPFNNPHPVVTAVVGSVTASSSEPIRLDVRGSSFLPNSVVELGATRLVTLYLGAQRLVAFVPPALRSSLASGIRVHNPTPGGGTSDEVRVGVPATVPLPINEVETGPIRSGYAIITPDSGSTAPISTLTFGMVRGGIVQSQAAILPTPLTMETSVIVDVVPAIGRNLGLAIANASSIPAAITLTLRNPDGAAVPSVSFSISARNQIARFVTELFPSNAIGTAFQGSITIQSSIPVSIIGLRFSGAEFSTMPVPVVGSASVPQQGSVGGVNAVMFPQFAMSGGWATTLGLVNTSSNEISGRLDIFDTSGNPMAITLNGNLQSTFTYSIPARGSVTFAPRDSNGQSPF